MSPTHKSHAVPFVEPHQILEVLQNPKEMNEDPFPHTRFDFVHDVGLV